MYPQIGNLDDSSSALSRSAGFYKGLQSAGGAVSWSLSSGKVRPSVQLFVNVGLFAVSFPLAGVLVSRSAALGQSPRDPKSVKQ